MAESKLTALREFWGSRRTEMQPVRIVMTDITGRVCIEFPDGFREWISRAGLRSETSALQLQGGSEQ